MSSSLKKNFQKLFSFFGLFDFLKYNLSPKNIGIDLGTVNTLVCIEGIGIVLNQPSMLAIINDGNVDVSYLFGDDAKSMEGKTPLNISVRRPLSDGVITNYDDAKQLISHSIRKGKQIGGCSSRNIRNGNLTVICVPICSTDADRRAMHQAATEAGAGEIYLIEEPMAAAIGADIKIDHPAGNMIVNIGGGTTEIAIISACGAVHQKSEIVGGNAIDFAIQKYIEEEKNLLIGRRTAEDIKINIGCAYVEEGSELKKMNIRGRDLKSGIPTEICVTEKDIAIASSVAISRIINAIREILSICEPDLADDIFKNGICLTGGSSSLKNLDEVIRRATSLQVTLLPDPHLAVIKGINTVISDIDRYKHILTKIG